MKLFSIALLTTFLASVTATSGNTIDFASFAPHITTWSNQRFEIDGQCDLVMVQDPTFAEGLGLDFHIRTKISGPWSYIKSAAIKIGDDILEIEGSPNPKDQEAHYWFNGQYQTELNTMAGFPVQHTSRSFKHQYTIDLSPKYPEKSISFEVLNEFIRFKFNGKEEVFGNSVGLLGDYKTGKTFARDGATELNGFVDLGAEWQVLPTEPKLFHAQAHPQFPDSCFRQEYPLSDSEKNELFTKPQLDVEEVERVCSSMLEDDSHLNDCISYVMAGRDMDVVADFLILAQYNPEALV